MQCRALLAIATLASVTACTSPEPFAGTRTAFDNPYAALEIENGPVGPLCDGGVIRDDKCWVDGIGYDLGRGYVRSTDGRIIRLDRNERRWQRERREAIQSNIDTLEALENGTPLPPDSPVLPENQSRPAVPPPPPPPPPSGAPPDG